MDAGGGGVAIKERASNWGTPYLVKAAPIAEFLDLGVGAGGGFAWNCIQNSSFGIPEW